MGVYHVWGGEPFWLQVGTYRAGEEAGEPMDTALLALPGEEV